MRIDGWLLEGLSSLLMKRESFKMHPSTVGDIQYSCCQPPDKKMEFPSQKCIHLFEKVTHFHVASTKATLPLKVSNLEKGRSDLFPKWDNGSVRYGRDETWDRLIQKKAKHSHGVFWCVCERMISSLILWRQSLSRKSILASVTLWYPRIFLRWHFPPQRWIKHGMHQTHRANEQTFSSSVDDERR